MSKNCVFEQKLMSYIGSDYNILLNATVKVSADNKPWAEQRGKGSKVTIWPPPPPLKRSVLRKEKRWWWHSMTQNKREEIKYFPSTIKTTVDCWKEINLIILIQPSVACYILIETFCFAFHKKAHNPADQNFIKHSTGVHYQLYLDSTWLYLSLFKSNWYQGQGGISLCV